MRIAVLFDGAGLARFGLEQAGHDCVGFEADPWKHHLSCLLGSGNCVLGDATKADLTGFDAVWASPPCQARSRAKLNGTRKFHSDYTKWCSQLPHNTLWIENVITFDYWSEHLKMKCDENWRCQVFNAAQFLPPDSNKSQNRSRVLAGRFPLPRVYQKYQQRHPGIMPCIMATEWNGSRNDARRASRYFGRKLTITECATYQGLNLPESWFSVPPFVNGREMWIRNLYESIGNGVPVYMAKAFGMAVINNHPELSHWITKT